MSRSPRLHNGFTLVELLVSIAILMLVLVMVGQIISSASLVTNAGYKRMDADSQARQILDRMSIDFSRMVKRSDADFFYQHNSNGNDQIAFYSETTGYYPSSTGTNEKSGACVVGYMIATNTNNNQPQLLRLSKGLPWNGVNNSTSMVYGTNSSPGNVLTTTWQNLKDGSDTDYQVIGNQVYRLAFAFLKKDGTITNASPNTTVLPQNISAVIVALAILDKTSRKIVTDPSKMVSALPDVALSGTYNNSTQLMAKTWNTAINSSGFATTCGIPQSAASQVRVYQRFFYLNPQ